MEKGSSGNMSNGSPGTIRLGTTTEDERDCYGVQEDEILGESVDDKSVGNQYTGKEILQR